MKGILCLLSILVLNELVLFIVPTKVKLKPLIPQVSSIYENERCLLQIKNHHAGFFQSQVAGCFLCKMGYMANELNQCLCNYNRGCKQCGVKNYTEGGVRKQTRACIKCNEGFVLDPKWNICNCIENDGSNQSRCKYCSDNKQICTRCQFGYSFDNYECTPSISEGCIDIDKNTNICKNCMNGLSFEVKNKSCICKDGLNDCKLCSLDKSYCEICDNGYFNSFKGCKCSLLHGCKKCLNNKCVKL